MKKTGWFFDFHSPSCVRINHNPDTKGMVDELLKAGVDEIVTFAKCHVGFSYYPTEAGTPHPRMKGDVLGEVVSECKSKGVKVLAYISFGIDGEAGRKHPGWVRRAPDSCSSPAGLFMHVCPYTGYLEELMLPQIAEIIDSYHTDGFFFDTMGAFGACYCAECREAYKERFGTAIPEEAGAAGMDRYGKFRHDRAIELMTRIGKFIQTRQPDTKVVFNHIGAINFPEPLPEGITCIGLDIPTTGPQSLGASAAASFGSTAAVDSDVIATIFNQAWAGWTVSEPESLEAVVIPVLAHGSRLYMGDRLHPENRLDPNTKPALEVVSRLMSSYAEVGPPQTAEKIPDFIVLHGPHLSYGKDFSDFSSVYVNERLHPIYGAHRLLIDAGANAKLVAECYLENWIEHAQVLVLPELPAISPETALLLRNKVEKGGKLIIVGKIPEVGGRPFDLAGVVDEAQPWQDHIYLPDWKGGLPVLVRGDFYQTTVKDADLILPAIQPYDLSHGVRFGWGIGPASEMPSSFPAVTRRKYNKGEVWRVGAPVFSSYSQYGLWKQVPWFADLINQVFPSPCFQVFSRFGKIEVIGYSSGRATWAVLVHHGGEELLGSRSWSRFFPPPPADITLKIKIPEDREPEKVTILKDESGFEIINKTVIIRTRLSERWSVIRVDWR